MPKAREINRHLLALLAKSHRWFEALKAGQSPSILSIAGAHGVESSDATQAVYLALLAPDIVERLVRGDHPEWLGVRQLLAMAPLPMEWAEQRRVLGMDGSSPAIVRYGFERREKRARKVGNRCSQ